MNLSERIHVYIRLTRLDRPIGILLLLWPTLWGTWIAGSGHPPYHIVFIFLLGTVLMRSAGCVVNDYADRDFDRQVKRTRDRPLTSGEVAPREALWLASSLFVLAFMLALSLNRLTVLLSVPALLLAVSYPYTKRYLAIPQAYLGIAFGFGIPMTFAAQLESVPAVAWWLLLANIFWAIAYDTAYAMVDRDDDVRIGIHSSALFFGRYDVAAIMACYAMTLITLFAIGWSLGFGFVYYVALCCAASIATYHYTLIRRRQREACFKAFMHNTWFGATVFLGIALDQLFHLPASLP